MASRHQSIVVATVAATVLLGCAAPVAPPRPNPVVAGMVVAGNRSFHSYLTWATERLAESAPDDLAYVRRANIALVRQVGRGSRLVHSAPPELELADATTFVSITWLASVLVHEACHVFEYDALTRVEAAARPSMRRRIEQTCIKRQLETARRIGAPERELAHLRAADGTHADTTSERQNW